MEIALHSLDEDAAAGLGTHVGEGRPGGASCHQPQGGPDGGKSAGAQDGTGRTFAGGTAVDSCGDAVSCYGRGPAVAAAAGDGVSWPSVPAPLEWHISSPWHHPPPPPPLIDR